MVERRNWTQLPPDLLQKIAAHLTEIPYRLRFRSVCFQWRSIPISKNLPQQLPWLVLLPLKPSPTTNSIEHHKVRFLSLTENRTYTIPLPPQFSDHLLIPSSHGWLSAINPEDDDENTIRFCISLVNPITRRSIPLPLLSLPGSHPRSMTDGFTLGGSYQVYNSGAILRKIYGTSGGNEIRCSSHTASEEVKRVL